jgi:hypothetical protein
MADNMLELLVEVDVDKANGSDTPALTSRGVHAV